MNTETETQINEIRHLKACVSDLISILALPALWGGGEPYKVISELLNSVLAMLRLDFAYARLNASTGFEPLELICHAQTRNPLVSALDIARAMEERSQNDPSPTSLRISGKGATDISAIYLQFCLRNDIGWVVFGSLRNDFPNVTERILLNVAVNQASIGLQDVRLLHEERRVKKELEQKVAERTKELQELKDQLQRENVALREQVDEASMFEEIIGTAPALQAVLSRVSKVAPTDSTVLITGETGTGKELIARAIHKRSERSTRAFVRVNCAAIPQALIASELFGHEKGAFTGAIHRRLGRFELAQGGTLFLDEVGELPAETQVALLRVLQEREFERVGGTQVIKSDARIIAATNRDLGAAIANGTFRGDLFYRLNVFPLDMPSLRTRRDDIPLLAEYFIQRYADKLGRKIASISRTTLDQFQAYSWPGNIRELQNVVERSLILCETDNFSVDKSWFPIEHQNPTIQTLTKLPATSERTLIERALAESRGRVSGSKGAAAKLGVPASTLESKIRSLRINKYEFKTQKLPD